VVVSYNDADTIGACLESVLGQDYPNRETVVVCDDGSTDGTKAKLTALVTARPGSFDLVTVPHTGRSAARNVGWKRGRGDIVFFADADDVYQPDYITRAVQALAGEKVGCVCVTGASLIEGNGVASRMLKLYSLVQVKNRAQSKFKPSWAWVYTRKALAAAGGFDESLSQAEDKDLFERVRLLGFDVAVVDGIHWLHRRPNTNAKYFTKTLNGGANRIPYFAKRHDVLGFIKATGIIWFVCVAAVLQVVYWPAAAAMTVALLGALVYRGVSTASLVWEGVPRKRDLLLYPFFNLVSHAVSAVGCLTGLVQYAASPPREAHRLPSGA
jgi:cellulose synthase/poly-beta-1,6-N-acetylglucosamine synthase-like glycosyltransferase